MKIRYIGYILAGSFGVFLASTGLTFHDPKYWIGLGLFGAYGFVRGIDGIDDQLSNQVIEESKEREKNPDTYANYCETCKEYVEEPMMVCGAYSGPDRVKLFLCRHTWEGKFREMVQQAQYGFQKIVRCTSENSLARLQAQHYLAELERLSKEGLEK